MNWSHRDRMRCCMVMSKTSETCPPLQWWRRRCFGFVSAIDTCFCKLGRECVEEVGEQGEGAPHWPCRRSQLSIDGCSDCRRRVGPSDDYANIVGRPPRPALLSPLVNLPDLVGQSIDETWCSWHLGHGYQPPPITHNIVTASRQSAVVERRKATPANL